MTCYQCSECGKVFLHLAKKTVQIGADDKKQVLISLGATTIVMSIPTLETYVCPFCQSLAYEELREPDREVEAVYVHDLTSGPQTALEGLLAQGYEVVGRYAKQYILEKKKETEK